MVSDFIDEHNGFLQLTDDKYEQARSSHRGLWKAPQVRNRFRGALEQ